MSTSTQHVAVFALIAAVSLPYLVLAAVKGTRRQVREQQRQAGWMCGSATVLDYRSDSTIDGPTYFYVYAALRTSDGREFTGWAADTYGRVARGWVGRQLPAWYDPEDPRRFRMTRPESPSRAVLGTVAWFVLVLACFALFAVLAFG